MAFRPLMKVAVRRAERGVNEAGTLGFEAPLTIEYPRKRHILYHICAASRKCRAWPGRQHLLVHRLSSDVFRHIIWFFTGRTLSTSSSHALHTCSSHVLFTRALPTWNGRLVRSPWGKSNDRLWAIWERAVCAFYQCEKRSPVSRGNGVQLRFLGLSRIFRQGCAMPWAWG